MWTKFILLLGPFCIIGSTFSIIIAFLNKILSYKSILSAIPLIFCIHIHNVIYFDTITICLGFHTKFYSISTLNFLSSMVEWFESVFLKKN